VEQFISSLPTPDFHAQHLILPLHSAASFLISCLCLTKMTARGIEAIITKSPKRVKIDDLDNFNFAIFN
jgi:hypothetical protein